MKVRSSKFILYAITLIASLLWLQRETMATEAREEIQKKFEAASTLIEKASASNDPAEKLRIYDEIINTYQNDTTGYMEDFVVKSIFEKIAFLPVSIEKNDFIVEMIDKFSTSPKQEENYSINIYLSTLLDRAGSQAEKLAVCNDLLEKQDRKYTESFRAQVLSYKAGLTDDKAEKIALYDQIMQFISSKDTDAVVFALIAALDKVKLLDDRAEQIRLCDLVIETFFHNPLKDKRHLFAQALYKKAELIGDPDLPLQLWQRLTERMTALNIQQSSEENDFLQFSLIQAMVYKAEKLADTAAKIEILNAALEKYALIESSSVLKELAMEIVDDLTQEIKAEKRPSIGPSLPPIIAAINEEIAKASNNLEVLQAMLDKARQTQGNRGKVDVYDEMIARISKSEDKEEIELIQRAIYEKSELIDNREEKITLYETLLFGPVSIKNHFLLSDEVFQKWLELTVGDMAKLNLYKRYIETHSDVLRTEFLNAERKIWLMSGVTESLTDPTEKLRLYNEIIEAAEPIIKSWEKTKDKAIDYFEEMGRDRLMASLGKAVLGKAEATEDKAAKLELYSIIIEQYKDHPAKDNPDSFIKHSLDKAITAKAKLELELEMESIGQK